MASYSECVISQIQIGQILKDKSSYINSLKEGVEINDYNYGFEGTKTYQPVMDLIWILIQINQMFEQF